MEKVPYFHNSSVACRFTLVNFRNGNGRVESVRLPILAPKAIIRYNRARPNCSAWNVRRDRSFV